MNKEKLWSPSYVADIAVNFLVYCVHFTLMLWSTGYAMNEWNASVSMAGLASGMFIVGALFARIPAGRFIDFMGRKKTFIAGTAVFFLMSLFYIHTTDYWLFVAIRFIHGMAFGTISTASSTIVAALIPIARMGTGIGYFTLGVTIASAVGPFFAMSLTSAGLYTEAIEICNGVTFVIMMLSIAIKAPERSIMPWEKEKLFSLAPGNFFSYKALGISFVAMIAGVCYSTVLSFLGAYTKSIGVTGIGASMFFICFAITSFISRPLTGYLMDRRGGNIVVYPALISMAIAMAVISCSSSDIPLLVGALFLGFGYGTTTAACHALAVHCAPQHQIGIATSTYFVLLDLGIGVGPYALGSVVPIAGFSAVYVIASAVSVIGIGLYYVILAREHRFTRQQMDRVMTAKALIAARRERFLEKYTENMKMKEQHVVQAENKAQEKKHFDEEVPTELKEEIRKKIQMMYLHGATPRTISAFIEHKYGYKIPLADFPNHSNIS